MPKRKLDQFESSLDQPITKQSKSDTSPIRVPRTIELSVPENSEFEFEFEPDLVRKQIMNPCRIDSFYQINSGLTFHEEKNIYTKILFRYTNDLNKQLGSEATIELIQKAIDRIPEIILELNDYIKLRTLEMDYRFIRHMNLDRGHNTCVRQLRYYRKLFTNLHITLCQNEINPVQAWYKITHRTKDFENYLRRSNHFKKTVY